MIAVETERREMVIGGAGFAGLALAVALRQALGEAFSVTVADPALRSTPSKDPRASAIAAAARRLFEAIGVWDAVEDEAQPILDMVVTDSKLEDAVRPTFLTFGGEVEEGEPFAHMIENRLLIDALVAKAKELGIDLRATAVTAFDHRLNAVDVTLADGGAISAKAAPRSISCPPGRSRSCRSPANAHRSCGRKAHAKPSASWRCPTINSMTSWSSASGCISAN
jgi:2-octaprenyl-6-methoxyphenol hydroxylase